MTARKKKKQSKGFSAEDVAESLNREVTTGGKKTPGEILGLKTLLSQAVNEKKYIAVKQLLETFDEVGAIKGAEHQAVVIFPKIYDYGHYESSFRRDGNNTRLPENYIPQLSKIGEREKAKKEAAYQADVATMKEKVGEAFKIANEATANLRNLPDPHGRLNPELLTTAQLVDKMSELDDAERTILLESQRLRRIRESAFDSALNAVTSFNKKWGQRCALQIPGRKVGYRNPPKHTQFKKGHSGNPRGRPATKKALNEVVKDFAYQKIVVKEGGRKIAKPIIQVVFDVLSILVMTGNTRAASLRRKYLKKYDPALQQKEGYLLVPEKLSDDEFLEALEEHRKASDEAIAKLDEMLEDE